MLIDGLKIAEKINKKTKTAVSRYKKNGITLKVAVFLVGGLKESELYVKQKQKAAERLGFDFLLKKYSATTKESVLIKDLKNIQKQKNIVGCIVQLPLPKNINTDRVLDNLDPTLDIDCLTNENLGRLMRREVRVEPPTAGAMMEIIRDLKFDLTGKQVAIVGAGLLVGRPLSMLLAALGATTTLCHSRTIDLKKHVRIADVVMTGAGKRHLITSKMIKKRALVIDAGFIYEGGQVFGDTDFEALSKKGAIVTPTPGGVGPITVAKLLNNAVVCANEKFKK